MILERADGEVRTWTGTPLVGGSQLGAVHQVMVDHDPVQYHDVGTGPVLLFVHGLWVNGVHVFDGAKLTSPERGPGEVLRHFER